MFLPVFSVFLQPDASAPPVRKDAVSLQSSVRRGIVLYTFVTGDARSASFQFIFYWAFAAADLLLYRERFWKRLGNFFFIVICLGIVEFASSLVYYVIVFLSGFRDFGAFDPVVPEDTPGDLLIFISFMSIAQFLVLPLCIYLWRHSVQHIHLKTLIQLVLAASLSGSGILYVFPEWIGPMGWIFVFIGTFLSVVLFFLRHPADAAAVPCP